MSAFRLDRRQLRRTAWAMLVCWVLALAAGVVNACALTTAGHHEHVQDLDKGSCLKFCDDRSSAIAKVKLPSVDLSATLLTAAAPWHAIVAAGGAGFRQSRERRCAQGPPLVIRFLRLTL